MRIAIYKVAVALATAALCAIAIAVAWLLTAAVHAGVALFLIGALVVSAVRWVSRVVG